MTRMQPGTIPAAVGTARAAPQPLPVAAHRRGHGRDAPRAEAAPEPIRFRPPEPEPPEEPSRPRSRRWFVPASSRGMAYTLYSDRSIEAELPIGTVRFGSIAELQDHVMRTGTKPTSTSRTSARR